MGSKTILLKWYLQEFDNKFNNKFIVTQSRLSPMDFKAIEQELLEALHHNKQQKKAIKEKSDILTPEAE